MDAARLAGSDVHHARVVYVEGHRAVPAAALVALGVA
jgi:hypothetical protein